MAVGDANREGYLNIIESLPEIHGRFTQVRRLGGSGGHGYFSLLFTAIDGSTGKPVALKFFHPDWRGDNYRLQCFEREAALLQNWMVSLT